MSMRTAGHVHERLSASEVGVIASHSAFNIVTASRNGGPPNFMSPLISLDSRLCILELRITGK